MAKTCSGALELSLPMLVDDMQDTVSRAYNAWPDRLFILGTDGRIAYRGQRGPQGFDVGEMAAKLQEMLEAQSSSH